MTRRKNNNIYNINKRDYSLYFNFVVHKLYHFKKKLT